MFVSIYYKPSLFNAHTIVTMILIVHIFMTVNKLCLNQFKRGESRVKFKVEVRGCGQGAEVTKSTQGSSKSVSYKMQVKVQSQLRAEDWKSFELKFQTEFYTLRSHLKNFFLNFTHYGSKGDFLFYLDKMYSHLYITAQKVICLFTLTRCTITNTLQLNLPFYCNKMYYHLYITAQETICLFTLTGCTTTHTLPLKQFAFLLQQDVLPPIHYSSSNLPLP